MKTAFLKLLVLCFGISLASCSAFYTRHYTKGFFYDGFAHRTQATGGPENRQAAMQKAKDSSEVIALKQLPEEKSVLQEKTEQNTVPENRASSARPEHMKSQSLFSPVLKKALKHMNSQIRAIQHGDTAIGKAAFYILALVLAVGILALAIYFLPAIMIPAAASSAFSTILLLGAIVVVCVFAFLIYTLIKLLIDLFKHKTLPEAEEF